MAITVETLRFKGEPIGKEIRPTNAQRMLWAIVEMFGVFFADFKEVSPRTFPEALAHLITSYQKTLGTVLPEVSEEWKQITGFIGQSEAAKQLINVGRLLDAVVLLAATPNTRVKIDNWQEEKDGLSIQVTKIETIPIGEYLVLPGNIPIDPFTAKPLLLIPHWRLFLSVTQGLWKRQISPLILFARERDRVPPSIKVRDGRASSGWGEEDRYFFKEREVLPYKRGYVVIDIYYTAHKDDTHRRDFRIVKYNVEFEERW